MESDTVGGIVHYSRGCNLTLEAECRMFHPSVCLHPSQWHNGTKAQRHKELMASQSFLHEINGLAKIPPIAN